MRYELWASCSCNKPFRKSGNREWCLKDSVSGARNALEAILSGARCPCCAGTYFTVLVKAIEEEPKTKGAGGEA